MNIEKLKAQIIRHEGFELFPYKCTAGKTSIGAGRNLDDKGISEEEAILMLSNDIKECYADIIVLFLDFVLFPESIQHVLLDMRFQLGGRGFRGFKKMITAVNKGDYKEMIVQMRDSAWYRQVTSRAEHLIKMMKEG